MVTDGRGETAHDNVQITIRPIGLSGPTTDVEKGFDLGSSGRFEEAIEYLDKVPSTDPNYIFALSGKGLAFYRLGRYQEAISYYDRALAIDPDNALVVDNKRLALDKLQ
jgi:tetratricopeptide (TPR) repeat protein